MPKRNIYIIVALALLLIAFVISGRFLDKDNDDIQENLVEDPNLKTIEYSDRIYNKNIDPGFFPKTYTLVVEEEGVLYEGKMEIDISDFSNPEKLTALYKGELREIKENKELGRYDLYFEIRNTSSVTGIFDDSEPLPDTITTSIEIQDVTYSGDLILRGEEGNLMYTGILNR